MMTPNMFGSKTKVTKENAGKVENKLYRNYIPLVNQNQYMDFSSWSDSYKTIELSESPFKPKYNEIDLLKFENLIATHKLNNDFVTLDESELKDFFIKTLEIIDNNLNMNK